MKSWTSRPRSVGITEALLAPLVRPVPCNVLLLFSTRIARRRARHKHPTLGALLKWGMIHAHTVKTTDTNTNGRAVRRAPGPHPLRGAGMRGLAVAVWLPLPAPPPAAQPCAPDGVQVQVLGSGGPELAGNRAASGYLVWIEGKARVLVDFGAGAALRFGAAGANAADLDAVLLTRLHAEYTTDLPALLHSSL